MKDTLYLKCTCSGELVGFEIDHDPEWRGHEFSIAIYSEYNSSGKHDWRSRLRWIWRILTTGKPYGDQVLLNADHAKQLNAFLATNLWKINGERHSNETR